MSKVVTTLTQLRDQPDDELRQALAQTRDELFRLHLGRYTNQVTSTAQLRSKRRDIARILTILNNRKAGLETQAAKAASEETVTETPAAKKGRKATTKKAKS